MSPVESRLEIFLSDVFDLLLYRHRRDAVRGVVDDLFRTTPVRLIDRILEGPCHAVSIQDDTAVDVTGGSPAGLYE